MIGSTRFVRGSRLFSALIQRLAVIAVGVIVALAPAAGAQTETAKIAVALSLTGPNASIGRPDLEGARLAVEEANAAGEAPTIELSVYDDASDVEEGKRLAHQIGASDALLVLGPGTTAMALITGPIYSDAGVVAIGPTATGDKVTDPPNFFRAVFSTGAGGEVLAGYLRFDMGTRHAIVLYKDDSYGNAVTDGFKRAAEWLGLDADYRPYKNVAEAEVQAGLAAAAPGNPPIVIAAYDADTVPVLRELKRQGARGPILGSITMAGEYYDSLFSDLPEQRQTPGFFTEGVYALAPVVFDSGNAETLAFAERFRERFGREPTLYSAQGYESARLAISAARATSNRKDAADLETRRAAIRAYLASVDSPTNGVPGLSGPMWFGPDRGRQQAIRMGRFQGGKFVSAPGQLVPVHHAEPSEVKSGAVVEIGPGRFVRHQQVVYTGIFLNEISRADVAQSTFTADFYLWMRFARGSDALGVDPTEIKFPTLVRGTFDPHRPVAQGDLDDGTTYRLWQVTGDFKNDYDLRHYPADRQTLAAGFFNASAASDRIVYVQDKSSSLTADWSAPERGGFAVVGSARADSSAAGGPPVRSFGDAVAPQAFRNLTQWDPLRTTQGRDNLVTESALGDPRLVGYERVRELSGFRLTVELRRRILATLAKTLLPLGLMSLIMYASLHFPTALVKEKVTVAITGALSGAVLLASINSQLGNVGYVIAIEYGFYAFFTLCLLCIVAVLMAERLRASGRQPAAAVVERSGRRLFVAGAAAIIGAGWLAYVEW